MCYLGPLWDIQVETPKETVLCVHGELGLGACLASIYSVLKVELWQ